MLFDTARQVLVILAPAAAAMIGGAVAARTTNPARRMRRGEVIIHPDVYQLGLNVLTAVRRSTEAAPVRTPFGPAPLHLTELTMSTPSFATLDPAEHLTLERDDFGTGYRLTLWHTNATSGTPHALMSTTIELEMLRQLYNRAVTLMTPAVRTAKSWGRDEHATSGSAGDLPRRPPVPAADFDHYGPPATVSFGSYDPTANRDTAALVRETLKIEGTDIVRAGPLMLDPAGDDPGPGYPLPDQEVHWAEANAHAGDERSELT